MSLTAALDRRLVLKGLLATSATAALAPRAALAETGADAILLSISDLHSPYARLPQLLAEVRAIVAEADAPVGMVINGDIFERGNAAATRSGGVADIAFLEALSAELPVLINLGNHETAIMDDMAYAAARLGGTGAEVIGNLMDRRTGRFFAPISAQMGLGGLDLRFLGVGTDNPFVYRQPARDTLMLLDPVAFTAEAFADITAGADMPVLVTHAGVVADRDILPGIEGDAVLLGAHDHLDFTHQDGGKTYMHAGAWSRQLGVLHLSRAGEGVAVTPEIRQIGISGGDEALAERITAVEVEYLTDADLEVITERQVSLDMPGSILLATEAVRAATEADIAVLGHTTFGAPLDQGPLTRYDFDAFVRFDGGLSVVEVSGEALAGILGRANQHNAASLDMRTGDYVHAAEIDINPAGTYRLATNGWTAINQQSYLGTSDLEFAEVEGLRLKAVVAEALAAGL